MKPVDVTQRVEFLSDGWIEVARRYLQDAVDSTPELATAQLSICESFTDAPPALGLPDDRAVWYFSIDHGRVDVGRGELPSADDEALQAIGRLHDHLAAHTIENPDFEHRVRRLGLERQVAELAEQGYTVIER